MKKEIDWEALMKETAPFIEAVGEAAKDKPWGEEISFNCPMCGGEVKAMKNTYNGYLWAKCAGCGRGVME